jgi:hypothetical protein
MRALLPFLLAVLKQGFAVLVYANQDCAQATDEAAARLIEGCQKGELPPKKQRGVAL